MQRKKRTRVRPIRWFVVTGRLTGDDEDTLMVTWARNSSEAANTLEMQLRDISENKDEDAGFVLSAIVETAEQPEVKHYTEGFYITAKGVLL
jgi:hypothetical protein